MNTPIASLLILAGLAATPTIAPGVEDKVEPLEVTERFLEAVGKGDVDKALDSLPKGALWTSQQQKLEVLRGQIKTALGLYGAYLGIERVRETRHSPSATRLVYLMKFEQHYLVWNMLFYKPKQRWELSWVAFVDQANALE